MLLLIRSLKHALKDISNLAKTQYTSLIKKPRLEDENSDLFVSSFLSTNVLAVEAVNHPH